MSYKLHLAGSILLGTAAAIIAFLLLLQIQHWRQDDQLLHAIVGIINQNIQEGHLVVTPPAAPPVASTVPKPPESPK